MGWIYCARLFDNEFQAGCYAARLREEGWRGDRNYPDYVAVFRTPQGRFGVKFLPTKPSVPGRSKTNNRSS
ncbi:hypothetical protein CVV65_07360 [Kyrpidia spormannii]|uniref:Uncharacterized protein n=2 Tax=Kyrpidia spormannii TaxID=2055160 RepID=A0A2K8NB03_9BACL|nr:hypothetical protein CVV65_07360 [Kyrpidia spormannii]CAB3391896.1 conserved protein of unknown function [Kyrpidia spormannii]CAB3392813.1 conserved protein of unknown function [Kyrpidia spormannii]